MRADQNRKSRSNLEYKLTLNDPRDTFGYTDELTRKRLMDAVVYSPETRVYNALFGISSNYRNVNVGYISWRAMVSEEFVLNELEAYKEQGVEATELVWHDNDVEFVGRGGDIFDCNNLCHPTLEEVSAETAVLEVLLSDETRFPSLDEIVDMSGFDIDTVRDALDRVNLEMGCVTWCGGRPFQFTITSHEVPNARWKLSYLKHRLEHNWTPINANECEEYKVM